jgi:hypothetical protein
LPGTFRTRVFPSANHLVFGAASPGASEELATSTSIGIALSMSALATPL